MRLELIVTLENKFFRSENRNTIYKYGVFWKVVNFTTGICRRWPTFPPYALNCQSEVIFTVVSEALRASPQCHSANGQRLNHLSFYPIWIKKNFTLNVWIQQFILSWWSSRQWWLPSWRSFLSLVIWFWNRAVQLVIGKLDILLQRHNKLPIRNFLPFRQIDMLTIVSVKMGWFRPNLKLVLPTRHSNSQSVIFFC